MAAGPDSWTIDDLHEHLQAAVELELLVIPPYLCALYSLHPGTNEEAALIIRSVVVEEMLHMILAANVLNAVGGTPEIAGGDWVPRYPTKIPYHRGVFEVGLWPFGDRALDTFLTIENPSYLLAKPPEASADAATPRLMTLGRNGAGYRTIGEFYDAIADGLCSLVERLGEKAVFTGEAGRQVGPEHYYASGGRAIRVGNRETALEAIREVVEQGEGEVTVPPSGEKFDPDRDLAHFYRFNELRRGRRYRVDDLPENPTGEPVVLDLKAVYPMKPNLRVSDIRTPELRQMAEAFNVIWSGLLGQIETALTGSPDELRNAVGTMFELKYAACELLRIPLPGEARYNAGPTFEVVRSAAGAERTARPAPV
jgi:Ferritin-like